MTTKAEHLYALRVAFVVASTAGEIFAQGDLTPPPGTPVPSMRTLSQVEPRKPISAYNQLIQDNGSYYLTGNLYVPDGCEGIAFATGNITLDLNGFSIIYVGEGADTDLDGIVGPSSITVKNGQILNFPGVGLSLGDAAVVEDVRVENCGSGGISVGEQSRVTRSRVSGCRDVIGIQAGENSVLEADLATSCGSGVHLGAGGQLRKSTVSLNTGHGIVVRSRCVVSDNLCMQNGNGGTGAGILVSGNESRIERNHLTLADNGLQVTGNKNFVNENTVLGNTENYAISGTENQLNLLLCEVPQALNWPCSVKLAGTLTCSQANTNGITVNADDVTIDLAGHALVGSGSVSGSGIYQKSTYRNLRVLNGKVVNWRGNSQAGIYAYGSTASLSAVQASTNYFGFLSGSGCVLAGCTANGNTDVGIFASVGNRLSDCSASLNRGVGIFTFAGCSISGCTAYSNGGRGISTAGSTLSGCTASYNGSDGFYLEGGCTLVDSSANGNYNNGIMLYSECKVYGCNARNNGHFDGDGAGIFAISNHNRIEGNNVSNNDRGIDVDGTGNFIARNTANGSARNWEVAAGNVCLVVQATVTTGAISGNSGGTAPGSTDPNANFTQ